MYSDGTNKATKAEMSVQTNIQGVDHHFIIRPDKFDSTPFFDEKSNSAPSDQGKLDDQASEMTISESKGNS